MHIVYYISGHGFGHASRSIELIKAIAAARPDARIVDQNSGAGMAVRRDRRAFDRRPSARGRHRRHAA